MRIRFLGDIAVAQPISLNSPALPPADLVVANLEGPLVPPEKQHVIAQASRPVPVYNSLDALDILQAFAVQAVYLANNHIYDLPIPVSETQQVLHRAGIVGFGAGANLAEAAQPFVMTRAETTVKLFAFGWDIIGCQPAKASSEGVNPFKPAHLLNTIRILRTVDQTSCVIFVMHWNYELEQFPQPAHRQLAHDLVRAGVDVIIGLHPHVVQGAEIIDDKPIVYSLGNWFFPVRESNQFRLAFPPLANRQLAFELAITGRNVEDVLFRWYNFDPVSNQLQLEAVEAEHGEMLQSLSPFVNMSHSSYVKWFKSHRTRKYGLPIYVNYQHKNANKVRDHWVKTRQFAINRLVRLHIKKRLTDA